jgi:catalase
VATPGTPSRRHDWIRDAFRPLKAIGHAAAAAPLFAKADLADDLDDGVIDIGSAAGVKAFIEAASRQRVRNREAALAA